MDQAWLAELRRLHDEAAAVDWAAHLSILNARYRLSGPHAFSTAAEGAPPAWFNGDVEAIRPGEWTLVVSLNPQRPSPGHYRGELRPETAWEFWRTHNSRWWYTKFFRPLVRLSATALGEAIPQAGDAERRYATERMIFVELCPYASGRFSLSSDTVRQLIHTDIGFTLAQRIRTLLLEQAEPALILINGQAALDDFDDLEGENLQWHRREYLSDRMLKRDGQPKQLWHYEGWYRTPQGAIPVGGFKFLRKPMNHNSNTEIDELGRALSLIVDASRGKGDALASRPSFSPARGLRERLGSE